MVLLKIGHITPWLVSTRFGCFINVWDIEEVILTENLKIGILENDFNLDPSKIKFVIFMKTPLQTIKLPR